jgi:predicted SAM-dependent methyltransferase
MRKVLNVGGNSKEIPLPIEYRGWDHLLLDIDPRGNPDICCDARTLDTLAPEQFDAIYCSHNLEHYYRHDGKRVLGGFLHVLKPDGFAHIRVPDLDQVFKEVLARDLDVDDVLYTGPGGPIMVRDVIYGWSLQVETMGNEFFAHKTGFTPKSLTRFLNEAGFKYLYMGVANLEIVVYAFASPPSTYARVLLDLPDEG